MIHVTDYFLFPNTEKGFIHVYTKQSPCCPHCGHKMVRHGYRIRRIIFIVNCKSDIRKYVLSRWRCSFCRKTQQEAPDILIPYKHYAREVSILAKQGNDEIFTTDIDFRTLHALSLTV